MLHELFERQVAKTPDAVALTQDGRATTYAELHAMARATAARLCSAGAGPETPVAVWLDVSPALVAALLGTLIAGAFFVPLDPAHPRQRNELILRTSEARLVVAGKEREEQLRALDMTVVAPVAHSYDIPFNLDTPVSRDKSATLSNLAYAMYTSGSTGIPKGVAVTHSVIAGYLEACFDTYAPIDTETVVCQLCSVAYAGAMRDMIGPLTRGCRVVLLRQEQLKDPDAIVEVCEREGVTALLATAPSVLRMIAQAPQARDRLAALELTLVGAESARPLRDEFDRFRLFGRIVNHYGTTECGLIVTYEELAPVGDGDSRDVVGVPVPGANVYVLDELARQVPVGAVGEIHFGGFVVSRGYLGQPGFTASRFLPDPFVPGARMYATGDLGRTGADGKLELIGRLDDQIKVRGYRVEVNEVEHVLRGHDSVLECLVIPRNDTPAGRALVAYVVVPDLDDHGRLSLALRRFASATLPDYSVPRYVVPLLSLPLGPTGKVDRAALPAPAAFAARHRDCGETMTELEGQIAGIWADVLGFDRVGVEAQFFDLGGDSLQATRIINRVRTLIDRPVPTAKLLRARTVRAMAEVVRADVRT